MDVDAADWLDPELVIEGLAVRLAAWQWTLPNRACTWLRLRTGGACCELAEWRWSLPSVASMRL